MICRFAAEPPTTLSCGLEGKRLVEAVPWLRALLDVRIGKNLGSHAYEELAQLRAGRRQVLQERAHERAVEPDTVRRFLAGLGGKSDLIAWPQTLGR